MHRILLVLIAALTLQEKPVWSIADWDWLSASHEQAFEALLPLTLDAGQVLAYRSYRDLYHEVPEQYLAVHPDRSGPHDHDVTVIRITPVGRSIQEQLLRLHRANPNASLATLLTKVELRRSTVASKDCPALRRRFDALPGVASPIARRNLITLHPDVRRFVIRMGSIDMDVTLTDDDAALVRWAVTMMAAVEGCATVRRK